MKNIIYLAVGDELLVSDLLQHLRTAGYEFKQFSRLSDLETALKIETPLAIVLDMVFNVDMIYEAGEPAGLSLIRRVKDKVSDTSHIFFISGRESTGFRLEAAQAGADRYFYKPLVINKFIQSLNSLKQLKKLNPCRVLLIDDEVSLLELYSIVLKDAGLQVATTTNPLETLTLLSGFKPDIVVLDFHMPDCSGPDLAKFIRQDDHWALIPIIFLSGDSSLNSQLQAMQFGGDDFLEKNMPTQKIVTILQAWVARARKNVQLHNDLKHALRENKFQLATMDKHDIVSSTDIAGRILSVNDNFCEISGYSKDELLGQNHRLLKSGFHPKEFYENMWQTISSGQVWHGVICNRAKDGREYWVDSTIVPFLDERGKPYKYVSARTDITSLRQSQERLQRSQDFAGIGMWDWDIRNDHVYWSDRTKTLYGYSNEVSSVTYELFLAVVHPDDKDQVAQAVVDCLEKGAKYDIEHRIVRPDGSIHWVLQQGDVQRDDLGKPMHMLGIVSDITASKNAEEALILAQREAEEANNAKSIFLSNMSHELRTPMNAIIGFTQLMNMDSVNPLNYVQASNLHEIMKAGDHLLMLINQLLDLSRIETGNIALAISSVKLSQVINEALQLIIPLAKRQSLGVKVIWNNTLISIDELADQDVYVLADFTRLKQVLINLLSNAVKYNLKNGDITVACNELNDEVVRLSVTDTGKGLSHSDVEQLFTAFNRLGFENTKIEGTGIGLMISKNIIEQMNGQIGVQSTPGIGSTFWIEIPLNTQFIVSEKKAVNSKTKLAETKIPDFMQPKKECTVLYIEDNPVNLRLVTQLLGRLPYINMLSAHEPQLGVDLTREHHPDLILLDLNLPDIDGYEVLRMLKEDELTRNIPVIAVSANAMSGDIKKGMDAGFKNYITKPIDVTQMLLAVNDVLTGR